MSDFWSSAVVYEVYIRSFADSSGDGVGDLRGLIGGLDHLEHLGVDALWITPFQPSPQVDNGYDVADYVGVDPLFGDMRDFQELLEQAHARGMRVLVDVVPNHCSAEHPLFQTALQAHPGSPERELFVVRAAGDTEPPNNWTSVFGGPAWHRMDPASSEDRDWYLHLFSPEQPDWNWENPAVHALFEGVLRHWFDLGVDGIRVDVAHALYKAPGLPDSPPGVHVVDGLRSNPLVSDQEPVHRVYERWRTIADSYEPPRFLVGEVNLRPTRAARFARPGELDQTFPYEFVSLGWDATAWCAVGEALEQASRLEGAGRSWAVENHDIVRSVTRYGGGAMGLARARSALVALMGLPGTVYLFQGEELGLPEVDVPVESRQDPMWARGGVCRDGARVPMPWRRDPEGAHGFSASTTARPWLPQPEGWGQRSVEAQDDDPASMLNLVRASTRFRRALVDSGASADDALEWGITPAGGLSVHRGRDLRLVVAMGGQPEALPPGEVLMASSPVGDGLLPTDGAAWIRVGDEA